MSNDAHVTGKTGPLWWPPDMVHRWLAEALGTGLLVVFGPGSVVAALHVGDGDLDYAGLGMVALSFGFVVALLVYAFGPVSGAHINPAVTVALAAVRRFPWAEVPAYVAAQVVGASVGGVLVVAMFGSGATDVAVGGTSLGDGVGVGQGLVAEAVGTFLLLLAVAAMALDPRAPTAWAGWVIGVTVACVILVVGPVTGASINPARTIGPYVATSLFGGAAPWGQLVVYVVGPLVGGVLGVVVHRLVARPDRAGKEGAPQE